jgi:ribosome-binding factor A
MNQRASIMASDIQRAVQDIFSRGLNDPRIRGMLTVTRVTVDDDLTLAVIYVSVFPHAHENLALKGLTSAATFIRREAGEHVRARMLPKFMFKLENAIKLEAGVLDALRKAGEDQPSGPTWGETTQTEHDAREAESQDAEADADADQAEPDTNEPDTDEPDTSGPDAPAPGR